MSLSMGLGFGFLMESVWVAGSGVLGFSFLISCGFYVSKLRASSLRFQNFVLGSGLLVSKTQGILRLSYLGQALGASFPGFAVVGVCELGAPGVQLCSMQFAPSAVSRPLIVSPTPPAIPSVPSAPPIRFDLGWNQDKIPTNLPPWVVACLGCRFTKTRQIQQSPQAP